MRVVIQDRECYELSLNILPVQCLDDNFHVKLTRRWKISEKPTEDHTELDIVLTKEELGRLTKFLGTI